MKTTTNAREKILTGAQNISNLVRLTLGPKGRNVIIARPNADPLITNDGITIARAANLADPCEALAAQVLVQASVKTNEQAGDGTTSAIVLAAELLTRGNKAVTLGESPVIIKQGLTAAAEFCLTQVTKTAIPIKTTDELRAIAANSCANNEWGGLVADALKRVGTDGLVTLADSATGHTTLTIEEGMEADLALASPYFCENPERLETVFDDARILITDQKINSLKEILPLLELAANQKFALVIVADDFSSEVTAALVLNKVRAGLRIAALKNAVLHDRRSAILGDIAALTGAVIISKTNDLTLANAAAEHLGIARKIICGLTSTKLFAGTSPTLKERILSIKGQIKAASDAYTRTRLSERLAKLTNGIAVISVGAATQIEQAERKLRIEDALAAARAAAAEGIVSGGGLAYLNLARALTNHIPTMPPEHQPGAHLLAESLPIIIRQICENADISPDVVLNEINAAHKKTGECSVGYNALTNTYCDLIATGISDPAKVIKCVIQNAVSVAGTLLTTEAVITT